MQKIQLHLIFLGCACLSFIGFCISFAPPLHFLFSHISPFLLFICAIGLLGLSIIFKSMLLESEATLARKDSDNDHRDQISSDAFYYPAFVEKVGNDHQSPVRTDLIFEDPIFENQPIEYKSLGFKKASQTFERVAKHHPLCKKTIAKEHETYVKFFEKKSPHNAWLNEASSEMLDELGDEQHQTYSDDVIIELLQSALNKQTIDIFAQPVVKFSANDGTLSQHNYTCHGFEFFGRVRARPGEYIKASTYKDIAHANGLMRLIDNAVIVKSIKTLSKDINFYIHRETPKNFFLNISARSITDTRFMDQLLNLLTKYRAITNSLILKMDERDLIQLPPKSLKILEGLKKLGCRISLNLETSRSYHIPTLHKWGVHSIRLSTPSLLNHLHDNYYDFKRLKQTIQTCQNEGIIVIAQYIEQESDLNEIHELGIDFGQGYLFGKPDTPGVYNIRLAA